MLRGPQTPGELKQRSERLHSFGGDEVERTLEGLAGRELVEPLERRPGQRERRYAQRLGGTGRGGCPGRGAGRSRGARRSAGAHGSAGPADQPAPADAAARAGSPGPGSTEGDGLAERVARLEQVASLRDELPFAPLRTGGVSMSAAAGLLARGPWRGSALGALAGGHLRAVV